MYLSVTNVYPRLEYKRYDLRPPSRLYHLEPIGIGTPHTESLTSYISRLAESHCWTTGTLFAKELAPASDKGYLFPNSKKNQSPLSTSFYPATPGLVGCGQIAEDWERIVGRLTLRPDLRHLTMLRWRNVFSQGTSSRPNRAWCSACLWDQKANGEIVYEHLLWMQKHVQMCLIHLIPLSINCPHCGRKLRPLADNSRVGHCSSCGNWLGVNKREKRQGSPSIGVTEEQFWEAEQVANLIARAPSLSTDPAKKSLLTALWKCVDECAGDYIPGFARYFGISHITVRSWRRNNSVPRFDFLLRILKKLELSLFDFIADKNLFSRKEVKEATTLIRVMTTRSVPRRKPGDLRQALLKILEINPPPSLHEVAIQLGYMSSYTLKKYHRDIYQLIRDRHATYIRQEKIKQPQTIEDNEKVRRALEKAKAQNPPPSIHSIALAHGYKTMRSLRARFPDHCREIQELRNYYKAARKNKTLETLNTVLTENPPPSLYEVGIRLGYSGDSGLMQRYPAISKKIIARYRRYKQLETRQLCKAIKDALREKIPQPVRSVAKRIGYNPDYLRQLFPDMCKAISQRFKKYTQEKIRLKKRRERHRVRRIAVKLITKGIYPSIDRVRKEASVSITLGASELCATLKEIRHDFDLNRRLKPGS